MPAGWAWFNMLDVIDYEGGSQPPKKVFTYEPKKGYVRLIQIRDYGEKPFPTYVPDSTRLKKAEKDDLLIARYGGSSANDSLGRICSGIEGAYNVALAKVIFPKQHLSKSFVRYLLSGPWFKERLSSLSRSCQTGFNRDDLQELYFPLPPLAEQQRIVAKLDALFEKIESNKKRLEKIPVILKRFRQSVLAAAVSGKLTEDWREKNKINNEWQSKQLDNIADVIDTHPSHRTPPTDENGIPYIGMGDIHDDGTIDFENARRVSKSVLMEHINRYSISEGDFIFGKIGTIGKPIFIPTERNYTISPNVILIKPKKKEVQYMYLYYYLNSAIFFEEVQLETKATSQPAYGIKKMRARIIPIPSISEQNIIINRVTLLMAFADKLETRYDKSKVMLDKLPHSILAKAFRGELVSQNPDDEPASVLLERIKEEKEKLKPVKKKKQK